jgi:hypothetical protein
MFWLRFELNFCGIFFFFRIPMTWLRLDPITNGYVSVGLMIFILFVFIMGWIFYLLAMALEKGVFGWTWQTAEPVLGYALFWGPLMALGILVFSPVLALLVGWQNDQWTTGVNIAIRLIPFSLGYAILWYGALKWMIIIGANRERKNENP